MQKAYLNWRWPSVFAGAGFVLGMLVATGIALFTDPQSARVDTLSKQLDGANRELVKRRKDAEDWASREASTRLHETPNLAKMAIDLDLTDDAPPREWLIVEGRVLGLDGPPRFPYLNPEADGLSRARTTEIFQKLFPALRATDSSGRDVGEQTTLQLTNELTAVLTGSWQNLYEVLVDGVFSTVTYGTDDRSKFTKAAALLVHAISGGGDVIEGRPDRSWIEERIKEAAEGTTPSSANTTPVGANAIVLKSSCSNYFRLPRRRRSFRTTCPFVPY